MDKIMDIDNKDKISKISVRDFLNNTELLNIYYIPYELKIKICNAILSQVIKKDGAFYYIDSVLLDRMKTQVIIETVTNLDFTINDEGLDGYDILCKENKLNMILDLISDEYDRFNYMINLKINDFNNNNGNIRGFIHITFKTILDKFQKVLDLLIKYTDNVDVNELSDRLKDALPNIINEIKD